MVNISFDSVFKRKYKKIKDDSFKIKKQISKIIKDPTIGKPMKHSRKGTRELHIKPYRLAYAFVEKKNEIVILDFYHKDKQ